jgi:hypothetical protein
MSEVPLYAKTDQEKFFQTLSNQPTTAKGTVCPPSKVDGYVELVSDESTRIWSKKLPNFLTLSVNVCTGKSIEWTGRVANIVVLPGALEPAHHRQGHGLSPPQS